MRELRATVHRRLAWDAGLFAVAAAFAILGASWLVVPALAVGAWGTMRCLRADAGLRWLLRQRAEVRAKVNADPDVWIDNREWQLLKLPD